MKLCKLNNGNNIFLQKEEPLSHFAVQSMNTWPLEGFQYYKYINDAYQNKLEKLDHVLYLKQLSNIQLTALLKLNGLVISQWLSLVHLAHYKL